MKFCFVAIVSSDVNVFSSRKTNGMYIHVNKGVMLFLCTGTGLGEHLLSSWSQSCCSEIEPCESSYTWAIECGNFCEFLFVWFSTFIMALDNGHLRCFSLIFMSGSEILCQISSNGNFAMHTPVRRSWRFFLVEVGYEIWTLYSFSSHGLRWMQSNLCLVCISLWVWMYRYSLLLYICSRFLLLFHLLTLCDHCDWVRPDK